MEEIVAISDEWLDTSPARYKCLLSDGTEVFRNTRELYRYMIENNCVVPTKFLYHAIEDLGLPKGMQNTVERHFSDSLRYLGHYLYKRVPEKEGFPVFISADFDLEDFSSENSYTATIISPDLPNGKRGTYDARELTGDGTLMKVEFPRRSQGRVIPTYKARSL